MSKVCMHSSIAPNMNRCIVCGKVWSNERERWEEPVKRKCVWPDCGHDTNQSDPTPGCNGKYCPK